MFLDLCITLFKKHVVSKSRKCVFLVLIFKLKFRPFQFNFEFFFNNDKKTKKNLFSILTRFLNFENHFYIQDARAKRRAVARTSPHPVCIFIRLFLHFEEQ